MARIIEKEKLSQEMQREVARKQQQIIQRYRKRLNGKKMTELQSFLESGKQVGSSQYLKLSTVVQEVVVQLNLSGIDIMKKYEKNPFRKVQLWLSKFMIKRLVPSAKKKAKNAPQKKGGKKGKKVVPKKEFLSSKMQIIAIVIAIIATIALILIKYL